MRYRIIGSLIVLAILGAMVALLSQDSGEEPAPSAAPSAPSDPGFGK